MKSVHISDVGDGLCLGRLDASKVKDNTSELICTERSKIFVAVPPHHGTHWHENLANMSYFLALFANGRKLVSRNQPFKTIAQRALSTFVNGETTIIAQEITNGVSKQ